VSYETLIQPVVERAQSEPDALALVFIGEDGAEERVTAAEFHRGSLAYADALRGIGIGPEDLVILMLNHSRVLLSAFWGALYLGAIPSIFPFLTEKLDPALYMERVRALVEHSRARAVITFPAFKDQLAALLAGIGCQVLSTDQAPAAARPGMGPLPTGFGGDKIAFLQHSSGTTGLQKGVALSHRAVLNQIDSYGQALGLSRDDVIVSWLPLYHDMGLIAGFILPITAGVPLVLMSPFHWVRSPRILFRAIHDHRGTLCWLPNFAYNHCVRAIRERDLDGIDLSRLRALINCSEPVHDHSHRLFSAKFAAWGFRESALATCYAMAENTFAVTQSALGQPPRVDWIEIGAFQQDHRAVPAGPDTDGSPGSMPMVSCGAAIPGAQVAVVGPDGARLPERQEGEVVVRSNSMLTGYYKRPDLTDQAVLDGWYKTGDMGYLAGGELFVSGRKKDLIIVGGKNVYPQDLETIANVTPGIYPGRAVAFGVYDDAQGTETVVMVCELEDGPQASAGPDEHKQIAADLRKRVVGQTEVTLADVRLVERRWVIKTSSGKIARADNRDKYLREFRST
jgi:acyl-CoA synthetase (AMP-forming)/AMP-acid ligase II